MDKTKYLPDRPRFIVYLIVIFIAFTAFALSREKPSVSIQPVTENQVTETERLTREIRGLKNRLARLEPAVPVKIVTPDQGRPDQGRHAAGAMPVQSVMEEGSILEFDIVYEDPEWVRPDYQPYWHSENGQAQSIPNLVQNSYHRLFISPGTEVLWKETMHTSGTAELFREVSLPVFNGEPGNTVAVIVFNHQVSDAFLWDNQVVLAGVPSRTGIQVIAFDKRALVKSTSGEIPAKNNSLKYLVQLVTPDGYEIDYNYCVISL
ncbi:MAG: hypothetical protein CVU89_13280 [Firmicutes bacterium HGW-Firmicutes-14]|nr:MAG: hypothetical protein CVU89_13280 [Firmicutes bacterium HGW-Firmicutes-14]